MTSQGGAYVTELGGNGGFRSPDHGGNQSRHGWGGPNAGDFAGRGGNPAYGVTPSLSGTSGPNAGGNGVTERVPGLSSPPAEPSRPLTQILSLTTFEIGDERWPRSRELHRAADEARPNDGEDLAPKLPPSLWTGEDAAKLVAALNEVHLKARERGTLLTSCLNKLDRWQNQVANRKRKKELQQTGASGGSLSSGNAGSAAPLVGADAIRGAAPQPAKKLRTSLVDVGAARPAKGTWGSPPSGRDPPWGVGNWAKVAPEESGDPEGDGNRSKKKRTRKSDANGDASWHGEKEAGMGTGDIKVREKLGKVWLGRASQGGGALKGMGKVAGTSPSKKTELAKKRTIDSPTKYAFLNAGAEAKGWPRGGSNREEKRTPGKERPVDREGGVLKGMRGPRSGVGGPNAAHLIRLKSLASDRQNSELGHTPRGVVKKAPPSGPVGGERKKSPLGGEKKRPASRSPSPSPGWKNPNKAPRLGRTNSAALKLLRDEYVYSGEKQFSWGKEKKGANPPSTKTDWRKSPKGGVLKVEKEGLVIEAPDGAHISVLKKSHKKGGSAQYRKEMAAITNRFMLDQNSTFEMGAIPEGEEAGGDPKRKGFTRGPNMKRGGRSSRFGRQGKAAGEDSFDLPDSRNGDATPSSTEHEVGVAKGADGGLDSWGKSVRSKRTTRQGPDRAAKKMIVGSLQEESEPESDEEMENELMVAFETLPQTLQERLSSDFWREVEPYFASPREEDLQFLRENFRELKEGDVVLSVPRCGEHFRKMWANEDQAWRFLLDDNPKAPAATDGGRPNGAEGWLRKAKRVSLSQRLLAALIDEEEESQENGKEDKQAVLALLPAVNPASPSADPPSSQVMSAIADRAPEGPSSTRDEEAGTASNENEPTHGDIHTSRVLGRVGELPTSKEEAERNAEGPESGAADSRGLDERIQGSAETGAVVVAGEVESARGESLEQGAVVLESDDEDLEIVNGVEETGQEEENGAVERTPWEQKFDAMTLDERIQWELQSVGLVEGKEEEAEEREDDPVCFELRSLQRQLREQLDADNTRLEALEQKAAEERALEEREREKWALFHFLEKLYERRKGARAGLGPGSSKGGKGTAQKKVAAREAFLATARRALRKVADFEAGRSVVPRGATRKWEDKARVTEVEEPAAMPSERRASRGGGAPLAVKDDRKAKQVAGDEFGDGLGEPTLPVVHSKGQRTRVKKPVNKGKRKAGFGGVLEQNGFGGGKELDLGNLHEREANILAEAQAQAAAEVAAAHAEAEQQAAAMNLGPANFDDMPMDLSALPLPDFANMGDDAFGGGFELDTFDLGGEFNELEELDKFGLDMDLGDMGF